jgi:serine/threonine protein kinase
MADLPEYKNVETYPRYEGKKLKAVLPRLSKTGLDLIERMLQADPQKRITAKDAMRHPYFADLAGAQPNV